MTETEVKKVLIDIMELENPPMPLSITRAIQVAKQIGSSWPAKNINLICHDTTGNGRFRMIIE